MGERQGMNTGMRNSKKHGWGMQMGGYISCSRWWFFLGKGSCMVPYCFKGKVVVFFIGGKGPDLYDIHLWGRSFVFCWKESNTEGSSRV